MLCAENPFFLKFFYFFVLQPDFFAARILFFWLCSPGRTGLFLFPADAATFQSVFFADLNFIIVILQHIFFAFFGLLDFDMKKMQKLIIFALKIIAEWCIINTVRSACTGVLIKCTYILSLDSV